MLPIGSVMDAILSHLAGHDHPQLLHLLIQRGFGFADTVTVSPAQHHDSEHPQPAFAEVLAELLRPPYVWWLLIAMVLQVYTPLYVTPVAAALVVVAVGFARQAVRARRPAPVRESAR
jgi:hypothetical protein